jgi:hypothetical protein
VKRETPEANTGGLHMKKNLLLGCLGLLGVVAAGAGVLALHENVSNGAYAVTTDNETIDLTKGVFTAAAGTEKAYTTWTGNFCTVKQLQGASVTAVNTNYKAAPRLYKGHYLSFETPTGVTLNSITITYATGYAGTDLTCGASTTSNGAVPVTDGTKPTGAIVLTQDTSALTWTTANLGSAMSVYIQNSYNNATSYTQLRPVGLVVNYTSTIETATPTSISFGSYATAMTAGTNQSITATMLPNNVIENVVWSVSDSSVASISDAGTASGVSTATIVPLNNGTFTVTAHAETTTSVTITSSTITVTGFNTEIAPKTLTSTNLGLGNGYTSNIVTVGGIAYKTVDLMMTSSDYSKSSSVVTYEKGGIQLKSGTGAISNESKFGATVTKVRVCSVSTTSTLTVKGGATAGATTSTATVANDGRFFVYTFATAVDYVVIGGQTSNTYINCVTFEFTGGAISAASLADYIIGIQPDRSDDTALCLGSTGNYVNAKARYIDAPVDVRQTFQDSTDATIVSARTRYTEWAAVYGDTTPFALTYGTAAHDFVADVNNSDTTFVAIIVSFVVVGGFAAFMMIRRKKQA